MASYTTNLNLKKPTLADNVSIGDLNDNMDKVDSSIGKLSGLTTNAKTSVVAAINEINSKETSGSGQSGITPHIGANGNWYIGDTDTGKPSQGEDGYSPTVSLTRLSGGVKIDVTNKDGTQTATVYDGADGSGSGSGTGGTGEDGGYYVPTVGVDGTLSWTPSKSGMPSVSSANIKGDKGDDGDPGAAGGYYTPSVNSAGVLSWARSNTSMPSISATVNIVNAVIAALPTYNGEVT